MLFSNVRNKYFILRHGESIANIAEIIISYPENGINDYGLSDKGKSQILNSICDSKFLDNNTIIISSDFKRAKETAEIVQKYLGVGKIIYDIRLRERNFGKFEKKSNSNYNKVWLEDKISSSHTKFNVESVDHVYKRVVNLIGDCENTHKGKNLLLVSHGDALQILQTAFEQKNPCDHRSLSHLEVAEIRKISK